MLPANPGITILEVLKTVSGYKPSASSCSSWAQINGLSQPHPVLRDAVADYLPREHAAELREMEALAEHGPFRRGDEA